MYAFYEMTVSQHQKQTRDKRHKRDRIEPTIPCETFRGEPLVAPRLAIVAIADRAPRRTDPCTAAREEQVIIQLVLRLLRPPAPSRSRDGGALDDDDDDDGVVRCGEDVPAEAVCIRLPAERVALHKVYQRLPGTAQAKMYGKIRSK